MDIWMGEVVDRPLIHITKKSTDLKETTMRSKSMYAIHPCIYFTQFETNKVSEYNEAKSHLFQRDKGFWRYAEVRQH